MKTKEQLKAFDDDFYDHGQNKKEYKFIIPKIENLSFIIINNKKSYGTFKRLSDAKRAQDLLISFDWDLEC